MLDPEPCPLCESNTAFLVALLNGETSLPVHLLCHKHLLEEHLLIRRVLEEVVRRYKKLNGLYKNEKAKKEPFTLREHLSSLIWGVVRRTPK